MANKTSCEKETYTEKRSIIISNLEALVTFAVMGTVLCVFIIFANVIVVIALVTSSLRDKARGKVSITKLLMASMSTAQVMLAVSVLPISIYEIINNGRFALNVHWCEAKMLMSTLFFSVCIYHIVSMAVDSYLAVCKPFVYRKMTIRSGLLMIVLSWTIPMILIVLPRSTGWVRLKNEENMDCPKSGYLCDVENVFLYDIICVITFLIIPLLAMYIVYIIILFNIRKFHKRKLKLRTKQITTSEQPQIAMLDVINTTLASESKEDRQTPQVKSTFSDKDVDNLVSSKRRTFDNNNQYGTHHCVSFESKVQKTRHIRAKPTNLKAVRTIGCIVISFTLCWMPYSVFLPMKIFSNSYHQSPWMTLLFWLGYFNAAVNPILYCSHRAIRKDVWDLICPFRN